MRFAVAALVASLAFVSAKTHSNTKVPTESELEQQFTSFVKTHNKKYTHDEFFGRFNTFKTNAEKIRQHNLLGAKYTMSVNQFADMTAEEFRSTKLGYKNIDQSVLRANNAVKLDSSAAPASVDWRTSNIVSPIKDQGQCGSCWAFSATGSIESAVAQKSGAAPLQLSEQQLVDCSTAQGNQGCNGGLMDYAFQWVISNKGITSEVSYPYKATGPNTCTKGKTVAATIKSFTDVPAGDEDSLLAAVAKQPVSVAIEADQLAFQFYSGGVLTAKCGEALDHGVLAVGYGTDAGTDYWIVKNSWGASWGESGYIRLERGINQCGIADAASYPTV
jgi:C1A family cysteine protease